MSNLKAIKTQRENIRDINQITSALQIIASTQSRQFNKRKRDYEPIRHEVSKVIYYLHSKGKLHIKNRGTERIHIMFSSDQKFCKNFLNSLHKLILDSKLDRDNDLVMLFGSRSYQTVSEVILEGNELLQYKALSTFDECESVALDLKRRNYPDTLLYSYDSVSGLFKHFSLIPFCSDETLFVGCKEKIEDIYYMDPYELENIIHMHLSSEIYSCMLESGLRERIARAMSMSEASNNAEAEANRLKRVYNVMRQSIITKEITTGS